MAAERQSQRTTEEGIKVGVGDGCGGRRERERERERVIILGMQNRSHFYSIDMLHFLQTC